VLRSDEGWDLSLHNLNSKYNISYAGIEEQYTYINMINNNNNNNNTCLTK